MSVGVMTVGVVSVGEITVGVMTVGIMTLIGSCPTSNSEATLAVLSGKC
jgi:uncharacterized protein YaiE (UPF0345 family)